LRRTFHGLLQLRRVLPPVRSRRSLRWGYVPRFLNWLRMRAHRAVRCAAASDAVTRIPRRGHPAERPLCAMAEIHRRRAGPFAVRGAPFRYRERCGRFSKRVEVRSTQSLLGRPETQRFFGSDSEQATAPNTRAAVWKHNHPEDGAWDLQSGHCCASQSVIRSTGRRSHQFCIPLQTIACRSRRQVRLFKRPLTAESR